MNLVIDLPQPVEARIEREAQQAGISSCGADRGGRDQELHDDD